MIYSIWLCPGNACWRLAMAAESIEEPKPTARVPVAAGRQRCAIPTALDSPPRCISRDIQPVSRTRGL